MNDFGRIIYWQDNCIVVCWIIFLTLLLVRKKGILVIEPMNDFDQIVSVLKNRRLMIKSIMNMYGHHDYMSGNKQLKIRQDHF